MLNGCHIEIDGGRICVFHSATRRATRKMVEERVLLEGAIIHPADGGSDDLAKGIFDLIGLVVGGLGVDDDAEVGSGFVKVRFLKRAYFKRGVCKSIVILSGVNTIGRL